MFTEFLVTQLVIFNSINEFKTNKLITNKKCFNGFPERIRTIVLGLNKWYVCTFNYHFVFNTFSFARNIQIDNIPFFNFFSLKIFYISNIPKIIMDAETSRVCSKYPATHFIQTLIVYSCNNHIAFRAERVEPPSSRCSPRMCRELRQCAAALYY